MLGPPKLSQKNTNSRDVDVIGAGYWIAVVLNIGSFSTHQEYLGLDHLTTLSLSMH